MTKRLARIQRTHLHQYPLRMYRRNGLLLACALTPTLWLVALGVHELGHVIGAVITGGKVQQVVLYPTVFSRTDLQTDPSPLFVVWAGPIFGVVLPVTMALLARELGLRLRPYITLWAAFCLILNGAYIGIGWIETTGDAADMVRLGSPQWALALFGAAVTGTGLYLLHVASPALGFGQNARKVTARDVGMAAIISTIVLSLAFAFGNPGP